MSTLNINMEALRHRWWIPDSVRIVVIGSTELQKLGWLQIVKEGMTSDYHGRPLLVQSIGATPDHLGARIALAVLGSPERGRWILSSDDYGLMGLAERSYTWLTKRERKHYDNRLRPLELLLNSCNLSAKMRVAESVLIIAETDTQKLNEVSHVCLS